MKVLHVAPAGPPVRGVSPYVDDLLRSLEAECRIANIVHDYRSMYPSIIHPARASSTGTGDIHWGKPWTWKVAANGDIAHVQHWTVAMTPMLMGLCFSLKRRAIPVVLTVHNPIAHERRFIDRMDRALWGVCDRLIVHGPHGRQLLTEMGIPDEKICVVPHGIRIFVGQGTERVRSKEVVLFGNLRGYKGVDVLLDAWPVVAEVCAGFKLRILGRAWDRQFKKHPSLLRTDVLVDDRFVPSDELHKIVASASLAVFPYRRFASQSGACCLAVGLGTPVVVSEVGELPLLAGNPRALVRPGSAEELADRLIEILDNPIARHQLTRDQSAGALAMSWARVARMHAQVYASVLGND